MTGPQQSYLLCALGFIGLCGAVIAGTRPTPPPSNEPIPAFSRAGLIKMGIDPESEVGQRAMGIKPPTPVEPTPEPEPEPKQEEAPTPTAAAPMGTAAPSDGRSAYRERGLYSGKYICREIESWAKAQELLRQGHDELDRDGDGVACEALR